MVLFSCSSFGWAGLTLVRRVTRAGVFLFVCLLEDWTLIHVVAKACIEAKFMRRLKLAQHKVTCIGICSNSADGSMYGNR